jgi:ABC-type multidrug transport system ATPase subunit
MLTGMFKASGGDAIIYGKSILDEMASIQKNIGLC